jgi:hypothetical protein
MKINALQFDNVRFWEKPSLYALKTLSFEKNQRFTLLKR